MPPPNTRAKTIFGQVNVFFVSLVSHFDIKNSPYKTDGS